MNNLGTREQGKKVYDKLIHKLDQQPKLTSVTYKAPDFMNLSKYMRQVVDNNRVLNKSIGYKKIKFTLRNNPPASTTDDYREVVINRKPTEL